MKGQYPKALIDRWIKWDKKSENTKPGKLYFIIKTSTLDHYASESMFLIMVMSHGGVDLETFKVENSAQIKSILLQVIWAIGLAEEKLFFEHRDLY